MRSWAEGIAGFYRLASGAPRRRARLAAVAPGEGGWYDEEMRTLLISGGDTAAPDPLVDLLTRGSTSLEQRRAADVARAGSLLDADRVVFWSAGDDPTVAEVAERYRRAERAEKREAIVFVTAARANPTPTLPNTETYVWPQDRDRLMMAFLTGA